MKLPTSVSMCLKRWWNDELFVHIMEKYLEETATYLDDPKFLKLHRLKRRFSRAALFPGIVRVPRTFRYNSFRIHKTQETSVLKTSDCLVQLKQLGDCFPKNQWQPQNIQVTDGILKYRKELKVGMDDENISWSKPVWCMSLYIPGCLLVIWLVYSSSMHGLNSNFHFPVY